LIIIDNAIVCVLFKGFIKENIMKRLFIICMALLLGISFTSNLNAQEFKVKKYSIGGEGGTDYLTAEPGTGRVFVSRSSHVMVINGNNGTVLGDIPDMPGNHGIALVEKYNHGFITCRGDSTVAMFDLKTLTVLKRIKIPAGGQDGITYDDFTDRIILTNHSKPGTVTEIDPDSGVITAQGKLMGDSPEGAASDGNGRLFINLERENAIEVVDANSMKDLAYWPTDPCEGPTGIAYDRTSKRIFSGCSDTSAVVNPSTGELVAKIPNGRGVDALGWDPSEKLIYIPAGRDSNVTIVHEDSPDKYTVVATVTTMTGAKTISVDPVMHVAYVFQPMYGPAPENAPQGQHRRRPRGPVIGAYLFVISH
jgi:DNA-binding beta-propeller fold protein YncE